MRISDWSSDVCSSDLLSYAQLLDKACEALTFGNRQALSAILDQEIKNGSLQKSPNNLIQRPQVARTEALIAQNIVRMARAELKTFTPVQVMRVLSHVQEARQEERRVRKECASKCRCRESAQTLTKNTKQNS